MFEQAKERLREKAALEKTKMLEERNQITKRSKVVLDKVQTTYQTQVASYEAQANAATALI